MNTFEGLKISFAEEDWLARKHFLADKIKKTTPTHQSSSHNNLNCHPASPSINSIFTREAELCDMCGIYASISTSRSQQPSSLLKQLLHNRGPDHTSEHFARVHVNEDTTYWISLFSTVLALRGSCVTPQPFVHVSSGSAFCWNGEAWKIGLEPVTGNDGDVVFELLVNACLGCEDAGASRTAVLNVLRSIAGPFAFVFLDKVHNQLYFGRDRLGRRSLLYRSSDGDGLQLSSIADDMSGGWLEVEADAVYSISLEGEDQRKQDGGESPDPLKCVFASIDKHSWVEEDEASLVSNPIHSERRFE